MDLFIEDRIDSIPVKPDYDMSFYIRDAWTNTWKKTATTSKSG